jgi:hypothetical protein
MTRCCGFIETVTLQHVQSGYCCYKINYRLSGENEAGWATEPISRAQSVEQLCYRMDDREVGFPSPCTVKNFLFSTSSTASLWLTQPPGVKRPGPRLRKRGSIHSRPHTPSLLNSVVFLRKRTIQTERPPHVGEVSAKFCG